MWFFGINSKLMFNLYFELIIFKTIGRIVLFKNEIRIRSLSMATFWVFEQKINTDPILRTYSYPESNPKPKKNINKIANEGQQIENLFLAIV